MGCHLECKRHGFAIQKLGEEKPEKRVARRCGVDCLNAMGRVCPSFVSARGPDASLTRRQDTERFGEAFRQPLTKLCGGTITHKVTGFDFIHNQTAQFPKRQHRYIGCHGRGIEGDWQSSLARRGKDLGNAVRLILQDDHINIRRRLKNAFHERLIQRLIGAAVDED